MTEMWEIGDGVPGPAGAAALSLGDDITIAVDVAEPSLLVGLTGTGERPITVFDAGLLERLGRLAVLEDTAREHGLLGSTSGWWDAEAVLLRVQAPSEFGLAVDLADRAREGAGAVLSLSQSDLDSLEPAVGDRVRAVAATVAATLDGLDADLAARLRAVARSVRRPTPSLTDETVQAAFALLTVALEPGVVAAATVVTRGTPGTVPERQVGLDPDLVPPGLAAAGPLRLVAGADNRSATARLTIPPTVVAPELWLTLTRRSDGVLLALLPMQPAARGTVEATITLHPPDDLDTVHIDVTVDPTLAPPSNARRALRAATARGRVAARAARLGQNDEAALLWLACSQRWADAGDGEREAIGRAWAALALERAGLPADADQLRRDAPLASERWAQERARRLPMVGAPFLAELMPS